MEERSEMKGLIKKGGMRREKDTCGDGERSRREGDKKKTERGL